MLIVDDDLSYLQRGDGANLHEDVDGDLPSCQVCEQREGLFEHAVYGRGTGDTRRYVGWRCRDRARQHGNHNRFAAAMVKRGDFVWLVSHPDTPYAHSDAVLPRR